MKKALIIILTALVVLSVFVACSGEAEDLFGKKITFDGNGSTSGRMVDLKVKKGEEVTLPANEFTRTDYVFAGWNTQADGSGTGYADKAKASFDDNTVLYAQWIEELTITFNANDKSETPATKTQKVGKGIETALDANTFTLKDFYFAGWSTTNTGEIEYADMAKITLSEDKTLYAVWSADPVVTLSTGTGISEVTGSGTYAPGATVNIDATVSGGYKWSKWTQTTGGADVSTTKAYSFEMGTENIAYTANAEPISYSVAFDKNSDDATGTMADQSFTYDAAQNLTANAYSWESHSFTGWNTSTDGKGTSYADGASVSNLTETDGATVTLYAQWSEGAVVTFYKNDGAETPTTTTQTIPFNTETALTKNTFSIDNYVFIGWNTAKDGTGTAYSDEQKVTLTENLDLYAQWAIDLATTTLSKTSWTTGNTYSMSASLEINDRITVTGSVTLILPKDKTLTASSGITVTGTNSLTIKGKGSLSAGGSETTAYRAAGIGGNSETCGNITINGGTVTATGGAGAAGIGGGAGGAGGEISISGGTVTANGGAYGAGIGGGGGGGAGGTVTIKGGTVTANGGKNAAGIGGGNGGAGGTISINGGTVTATGGSDDEDFGAGSGIGGGGGGNGGTVNITGGTVTATGGSGSSQNPEYGTGIGRGNGADSDGTLTIGTGYVLTGGSASADTLLLGPVDAETTYSGALHPKYMNVSTVSEIKDSTSAITLKSGVYTTDKTDNEVVVSERITIEGSVFLLLPDGKTLTASKGITVTGSNSLTINGGTGQNAGILNATGDYGGAGIGGSYGDGGSVTISGGTVNATGGGFAAGIGGGMNGNGGTVTINDGTVNATGGSFGAGIGGGKNANGISGKGGDVTIKGGTVTATGGDVTGDNIRGTGIGRGGYDSGKAEPSNGTLKIGTGVHVYETGSGSPYANGPMDNVTDRRQNMTVDSGK